MDALQAYAQGVFEFPDGKFTITPAKKKGGAAGFPSAAAATAESKDDMEKEAVLIESDQQLEHHLNGLPVDNKHAIHFRFAVVLGQMRKHATVVACDWTTCVQCLCSSLFLFGCVCWLCAEQKQFGDWRWDQIAKSLKLSSSAATHTEANPLRIMPMSMDDRLARILDHAVERLRAERTVLPPLT